MNTKILLQKNKWTGKKGSACLITGVAGFVGSHLAQAMLALGWQVIGVDNFFSGYIDNMAAFTDNPNYIFYEASITDRYLLPKLQHMHPNLSVVFNLAAIVSVPYSLDHEQETLDVNQNASHMLLAQALELGLHRFVQAGSAAEYGFDPRLPLREEYITDQTQQLSPYGRAKYFASNAVAKSPIGVSLRFFNIYGPRQAPNSPYSGVISKFIDQALAGFRLTIFGSGDQSRDFIHVSDAVRAYIAAIDIGSAVIPAPGAYNIGTGRGVTILELGHLVQTLIGSHLDFLFQPPRSGDILHSRADATAFSQATGWCPTIDLEDGLRQTIIWLQQDKEIRKH